MPLGTRWVLCRVQRTRVTVGETGTACGRWHGRCKDAPHGGVAVVGLKRLEVLLIPVSTI
jgi:hypothetical protein